MKILLKFMAVFLVVVLAGCGSHSSSDDDNDSGGGDTPETPVAAISLTAEKNTIATGEGVQVSVRLYNSSGQLITTQKVVSFSLNNPILASISSPVTTSNGQVSGTLTAGSTEGSVTLTASVDDVTEELTLEISDRLPAADITMSSNPASITTGGTAVVSARVVDSDGQPMPDGTSVSFSVNNTALGSIVPQATVSGGDGVALATFSAGSDTVGTATITATSGSVSSTTTVNVTGAAAGSIEFISAEPQIIVIKNNGGQETSLIQFLVKDSGGNPVLGSQTVRFTLSGPNGGEYLGSTPGATTVDVGTVSGVASTTLHSGTIPGTATVVASVVGSTLSSSSGVIAIGGGTPSAKHFSLSTETLNLEGLAYDGMTTDITARLADRYGNYNVLQGTAVSFYAECGAINRAINLSAEGEGSVTFRTQEPRPHNVVRDAFDNAVATLYASRLGVTINDDNNPRNGLCTIVAVVDGEEEFVDANANGEYDLGETFVDTYDDIHLDKDDDSMELEPGQIAAGNPYDPTFEHLIVDRDEDGTFDGMNGSWDANKRIAKQIKLLMTGVPGMTIADENGTQISSISVPDGGSAVVYFSLHDLYYNPPIAGTEFDVSVDVGAISGTTEYTYLDTSVPGAPIFSVRITDDDPGDADPSEFGTLVFEWTWKGSDYATSVEVEVD